MRHSDTPDGRRPILSRLARAPGALLFALALGLAMGFYAWTIQDGARRVTDWLLILPVALIGIAALVVAAASDIRKLWAAPETDPETGTATGTGPGTFSPAAPDGAQDRPAHPRSAPGWLSGDAVGFALMLLVLAYALTLPWLGFDVGTAIFIALALVIQGERRWLRVGLASVVATGLCVYVFKALLGLRLPTLLL